MESDNTQKYKITMYYIYFKPPLNNGAKTWNLTRKKQNPSSRNERNIGEN